MGFTVIGIILSVGGFISGIIAGATSKNFGVCLLVWLSAVLYVLPYFGLGNAFEKIEQMEQIIKGLSRIGNNKNAGSNTNVSNTLSSINSLSENDTGWGCTHCGERNPSSANTCLRCGERRKTSGFGPVASQSSLDKELPGVFEWKCSKCGKINQNYVGTCGCGQAKRDN